MAQDTKRSSSYTRNSKFADDEKAKGLSSRGIPEKNPFEATEGLAKDPIPEVAKSSGPVEELE